MSVVIDTKAIATEQSGYIVDCTQLRGGHASQNPYYVTATGSSLAGRFDILAQGEELTALRTFARPTILASVPLITQNTDFSVAKLTVKKSGSNDLCVPETLKHALPLLVFCAQDVKGLYGAQGFKRTSLDITAKTALVEPGHSLVKTFSHRHSHVRDNKFSPPDLIYSALDILPTRFFDGQQSVLTEESSLTRFGAEIDHEAQKNPTGVPLRRNWMSVFVQPYGDSERGFQPTQPWISQTTEDTRQELISRAEQYLAQSDPTLFRTYSTPQPLFGD